MVQKLINLQLATPSRLLVATEGSLGRHSIVAVDPERNLLISLPDTFVSEPNNQN